MPPASSYEGGERRCFAAMYACTQDVAGERGFQLHAYGRHLAAWYGQHKAREVGAARAAMLAGVAPDLPPPPAASALRTLGFASKGEHGGGEVRLRVVFQQRDKTRLLVNLAELLERCNGWSYRAPSGATVRALCWQVAEGWWGGAGWAAGAPLPLLAAALPNAACAGELSALPASTRNRSAGRDSRFNDWNCGRPGSRHLCGGARGQHGQCVAHAARQQPDR